MAIPDFQSVMLPLLRVAGDGKEHRLRDLGTAVADDFGLEPEERTRLLPSGRQAILVNRVAWASIYLRRAGLLETVSRGVLRITPAGTSVLETPPAAINIKFLQQFPSFVEFQRASRTGASDDSKAEPAPDVSRTVEETLEEAHQSIRGVLAQELLDRVQKCRPEFFEHLVVELLVKMGYGGSRKDAGERVGQSGDGGIDGIIKEDRLGLDVIYLQAKRWQDSVGRPEVQKFVGALQGQHARKGVFLTTSTFTKDAIEYAARLDSKVVLIDGKRLAELMIDFDLGVSTAATFSLKRIDSDYFDQE
jgi:restriction system protein